MSLYRFPFLLVLVLLASSTLAPAEEQARAILDASGIKGGLIVHVGVTDGALTEALRAGPSCTVHGLATADEVVARVRTYLQQQKCSGPVAVARFDGKHLPYAENLVNLLVLEQPFEVTREEALRVLAPGGLLYVRRGAEWEKTVKPRPSNIDEWTHYQHDPSGNPVAHDDVIDLPRRLQWTTGPRHTRSHEHTPSVEAVVSSGGRLFYIADQAPIASIRESSQWELVARDAFNGARLWTRPVETWYPQFMLWASTPVQLQRRLVALGDRVFVTLGLFAPVSVLDAGTGEVLKRFEGTEGAEEVIVHRDVLLVVVRAPTGERLAQQQELAQLSAKEGSPLYARATAEPVQQKYRATEKKAPTFLVALDAQTGLVLWKKEGLEVAGLRPSTLCALDDRVFVHLGKNVVCMDLKSGKEQWSQGAPLLRLAHGDRVLCADGKGEQVTALSAESGKPLWSGATALSELRDLFVAGGSVWAGGFKPYEKKVGNKIRGAIWGSYYVTQLDLATGKTIRQIEEENPQHHHRCYDNKATDRYILGGRRGTEFIDLKTGDVRWNSWARGVCRYGILPSNGLLYTPPHACGCYVAAKLNGFNALASGEAKPPAVEIAPLEKGPAFDAPGTTGTATAEWPIYRHDAARSGAAVGVVPAQLKVCWRTESGGLPTPPTVAGGKVIIACADRHLVQAFDADSGRPSWSHTTGGRVDSPPTLYKGMALFGSRDGFVQAVRLADGVLVWRLRVARQERLIVADGQVESSWPVSGSVLVDDGVVACTVGRLSYLDGGVDLCRLDPLTGKLLSRTTIYSPDPETGNQPPQTGPSSMPGVRADLLSADAKHFYLRDAVFDREGRPQERGDAHLLTLTDYLDDTWAHRSYWIFGTHCSLAGGCSGRDKDLIYGRLLAFNDTTVFSYGRKTVHWSDQMEDGPYQLAALNRGDQGTVWNGTVPVQVRAMVLAGDVLFIAGQSGKEHALLADLKGGAVLLALSAKDGKELGRCALDAPPVFDGMSAAGGRLYVSLQNGQIVCLE